MTEIKELEKVPFTLTAEELSEGYDKEREEVEEPLESVCFKRAEMIQKEVKERRRLKVLIGEIKGKGSCSAYEGLEIYCVLHGGWHIYFC